MTTGGAGKSAGLARGGRRAGHPLARASAWAARAACRATPSSTARASRRLPRARNAAFHGGKRVKGHSRHVAIDSQGTLLAVHVRAANKADGAEAGAVMVQACERHPSIESFTADGSYQRQAEQVDVWAQNRFIETLFGVAA